MLNLSYPSLFQGFPTQKLLEIRQEFIEHFLFPFAGKVSLQELQAFILALKSAGEKISLEMFISKFTKHVQNITEQDARTLFMMHQLSTQLNQEPQIDQINQADFRSLILYLMVQLFQQHFRQSISLESKVKDFNVQQDHRQLYQEAFKSSSFSPINSPRAKTMRPQTLSECQQVLQYLRTQLKTILKFMCFNFDQDDEVYISDKAINTLSLILKSDKASVSQAVFDRSNAKMTIGNVADILQKSIGFNESDIHTLSGYTKSVTIKTSQNRGSTLMESNLRITQCEDSHIFIDYPLNTLSITQCTNCTIFVASVKFVTTISYCEKVTVCVASNILRIQNTIDSSFYYYGSYAPLLYGDCRSLLLGPHNGNSLKLLDRLRESSIPVCKKNAEYFKKPLQMQGNKNIDYNIVSPDDLSILPLPDEHSTLSYRLIDECQFDLDRMGKELTEKKVLSQPLNLDKIVLPPLAPAEYQKNILARYKRFSDLQTNIKLAGIREEDAKLLLNAIQGNFREWIVSTGAIKPINDLVKLIDDQN